MTDMRECPEEAAGNPVGADAVVTRPHIVAVPTHQDERGLLGVLEWPTIPFQVHRVYLLYGSPEATVRGEHAHRSLEQGFVAVQGPVTITLTDGSWTSEFTLETPDSCLLAPAGYWRTVRMSEGASCLVLASLPFDEADYIRDYKEFLAWKQSRTSS